MKLKPEPIFFSISFIPVIAFKVMARRIIFSGFDNSLSSGHLAEDRPPGDQSSSGPDGRTLQSWGRYELTHEDGRPFSYSYEGKGGRLK